MEAAVLRGGGGGGGGCLLGSAAKPPAASPTASEHWNHASPTCPVQPCATEGVPRVCVLWPPGVCPVAPEGLPGPGGTHAPRVTHMLSRLSCPLPSLPALSLGDLVPFSLPTHPLRNRVTSQKAALATSTAARQQQEENGEPRSDQCPGSPPPRHPRPRSPPSVPRGSQE